MPGLKSERRVAFYRCGKCRGNIRYAIEDGIPDKCPECSYEHGTRPVNDIPSTVKLNLNDL